MSHWWIQFYNQWWRTDRTAAAPCEWPAKSVLNGGPESDNVAQAIGPPINGQPNGNNKVRSIIFLLYDKG